MKTGKTINYKGYEIYLNRFDEYCVIKKGDSGMIHSRAGFDTLEDAKRCVDILEN